LLLLLLYSFTNRPHTAAAKPNEPETEMSVLGDANVMTQVLSRPATKLPTVRMAIEMDCKAAARSGSPWASSTSAPSAPVSAMEAKTLESTPTMHISP